MGSFSHVWECGLWNPLGTHVSVNIKKMLTYYDLCFKTIFHDEFKIKAVKMNGKRLGTSKPYTATASFEYVYNN